MSRTVSPNGITKLDILLAAAATFEDREFTDAELTIACWMKNPQRFGLAGYSEHPCSNTVRSLVCGARGVVARGWVERTAPNRYRLTDAGRTRLEHGQPRKPVEVTEKPKLTTKRYEWLAATIKRYKSAMPVDRSTLADALRFWECREADLPEWTKVTDRKLREIIDAFRKRDTIELPCGMQVDRDLVCSILDYHMRLAQRFERTIKTIAARRM
jgi:hypothetical protein